MRKFIFVVILFLGVALVILSFGELGNILQTVKRGNPWYLLLALCIQFAWFFVIGRMFRSIFRLLGMDESTLTLSLIAVAVTFINVVAPTAGMGGVALFAAEAKRRGHPSGKATVAAALFLLFDEAAFLCILALGLVVLSRRNNLSAGEITASLILFSIACAIAAMLYLGYRSAVTLGNVLAAMARLVNRFVQFFIHRNYLSEERAHEFAREIADGLSGITKHPVHLLRPILWGLLNKALLMSVLGCSFLAFNVPYSAGTLIGGFSIGYLFMIVSPTPSGIGVVEGVMALALASLSVDWSQSVVVTLAYRAFTFWVPLGVGALAFRKLNLSAVRAEN